MPRLFQKARDPVSSYTHFLGAALSALGLVVMAVHLFLSPGESMTVVVSCMLFCLSLIALYCASGFYHYSNAPAQVIVVLRKLDHAMIYVLIAGSYTPLLLNLLPRPGNVIFTVSIWGIALAGIVMKLCWITAPRWLGTSLYILMGWAIVVDIPALASVPPMGIFLLVAGGLSYTIGGVIYALKRPNLSFGFGFHELFHVFVLVGSLLHYVMIFFYIA